VAEERRRPRQVSGDGIAAASRRIDVVDVARPRIARDLEAFLVVRLVERTILGNIDSSLLLVDGARSSIGTAVSSDWAMLMFGCVITNENTARVSGSDSGYSPAPPCV